MSNATYSVSQPSILVVDPDTVSLLTIATVLDAREYAVKTACSLEQALDALEGHPLDLVITETRLEKHSGEELVHQLHSISDYSDVPVMFLTANQSCDVVRRNHTSGAAFHLKKPIDAEVLFQLVDKALWMPHLVKSHIEQKSVRQPHISFAKNPLANPLTNPFATNTHDDGGFGVGSSTYPESPITF
jgi:CheY-like chemotaxis protein